MSDKLQELEAKIESLENAANDVSTAEDVAAYFNKVWPDVSDVLTFVKDMKLTGKRTDKKIQAVLDEGSKVYATTSDPEAFAASAEKLAETLDSIDDKIDKIISILTFVTKIFKKGKFNELLDKTIDLLTKVSKFIDDLEDKLDDVGS